jgi:hypothetical protein
MACMPKYWSPTAGEAVFLCGCSKNAATIIKQGPGFNINGVKVGGAAAPAKATTTVKAAASSSKQQTSGSAAAVKHTKK